MSEDSSYDSDGAFCQSLFSYVALNSQPFAIASLATLNRFLSLDISSSCFFTNGDSKNRMRQFNFVFEASVEDLGDSIRRALEGLNVAEADLQQTLPEARRSVWAHRNPNLMSDEAAVSAAGPILPYKRDPFAFDAHLCVRRRSGEAR